MTRVRIASALGLALAATAAGCRVDELDLSGKRCPCVAGWVCEAATDTCVRDPLTIDAAPPRDADDSDDADDGDARGIDAAIDATAIDAPPGSSCLGGDGGATLFSEDFADLIGWVTRGGTWSAVAGEARQADTGGGLSYAFPAGTDTFTDYRMASLARAVTGTGSLELALRIQPSGDGQYGCAWTPSSGNLRLQWLRANGTVGGTLVQTQVAIGSIPGYDPLAARVIEASVVGSQLVCCVRDLAGASITISDTRYTAGAPGLKTTSLAAGFADLAVNAP